MTYQDLLTNLQNLTEEQLQEDVILFDLYKEDSYGDAMFDSNALTITFGEN
jgi:hypothetical protein